VLSLRAIKVRIEIALLVAATLCAPLWGAEPRWPDEREATPFLCHADFSLADETPLLGELGLLKQDLIHILDAKPAEQVVHLFLFETKETYQAYLKQHFPRVPARRALYIKARGPGMVFAYRDKDFAIDVRHECTHAVLHTWLENVPLWLDEGLAEYFEVPRQQRAAGNPHLASVRTLVRFGELPRLEALEEMASLDEMGREEYRNAWAWTHFLLHGPPEAKAELLGYLADLQSGADAGPLSARLRRRLPDLERQLAAHFGR
jgi:hypothetical protein